VVDSIYGKDSRRSLVTTTIPTEETPEGRFVTALRKLDSGARAELRRSLSCERPSAHLPAYRYVERYVPGQELSKARRRDAYYLVAGLFALVERQPSPGLGTGGNSTGTPISLAQAIKRYGLNSEKGDGGMSGLEKRFLTLLDSDEDQLPYRLRQMLQLITRGQNAVTSPLDWAGLLADLQAWDSPSDWVRQKWAKEFYRPQSEIDRNQDEENEET
jgi:CRISPR system Cascade subunit CasB